MTKINDFIEYYESQDAISVVLSVAFDEESMHEGEWSILVGSEFKFVDLYYGQCDAYMIIKDGQIEGAKLVTFIDGEISYESCWG